eukprot:471003-Pleurochrysis_carterae.AAC.4
MCEQGRENVIESVALDGRVGAARMHEQSDARGVTHGMSCELGGRAQVPRSRAILASTHRQFSSRVSWASRTCQTAVRPAAPALTRATAAAASSRMQHPNTVASAGGSGETPKRIPSWRKWPSNCDREPSSAAPPTLHATAK